MAAASSCGCPLLSSTGCGVGVGDIGKKQQLKIGLLSSVKIPPSRLHSTLSSVSPVGVLRGGRNCGDPTSRAIQSRSEPFLGLLTTKAEELFVSSFEFGSRRGEEKKRGGIAANVVSRTGVSTLEGNHGSNPGAVESDGEVQHQERDGSMGGSCRDNTSPPAVSSNGSVTADVEVEVAVEEANSGEDLDPEVEWRGNVTENGEQKNRVLKGQPSSSKSGMRWSMLLSTAALEDAHLSRASSVTDAHVLRRKGRLKEQDGLIEFIISMHNTHSPCQMYLWISGTSPLDLKLLLLERCLCLWAQGCFRRR